MPRYANKRNYRKTRARSSGAMAKANAALRIAKKAAHSEELRVKSTTIANALQPNNVGSCIPFDTISQGDLLSEREGNTIKPTSVVLKGILNQSSGATHTSIRLICFKWKVDTPVTTDTTSILEDATTYSFKSEANKFKSQILWDRTFQLSVDKPEIQFQKKLKLKGFIGYDGSVSGSTTNGHYLLILSDEAANKPTVTIKSRLFFHP